jgi:hypothetical protein
VRSPASWRRSSTTGDDVLETLPLALPPEEERSLARSACVVRAAIDGLSSASQDVFELEADPRRATTGSGDS